jgi:hypothetical protein
MKTLACWVALPATLLLLTACPEVDETREAIEGDDPAPPTTALPPATGEPETFAIVPESGETIGGEVQVAPALDGESQIGIEVRGAPSNASIRPAVHEGTCTEPGPPVAPLDLVYVDGEGRGASTTELQMQPEQLMDGRHVVVLAADFAATDDAREDRRDDDDREARVIACSPLSGAF